MKECSYTQEFNEALDRELCAAERDGNKTLCIILFGSLTYRLPSMYDYSKLKSDADVLIIVEDDERGGGFNNKKVQFSQLGMLGGKPVTKFSERIPNAEIYVQSESAIRKGLDYLVKQCDRASKYDYVPLQLSDTAILCALLEGLVLKGEIPSGLYPEIDRAEEVVLNCKNRTDKPRPTFLF